MKKHLTLIFSVIALFTLAGHVYAQKRQVKAKPVAPAASKANQTDSRADFYGGFEGSTYKNKFFGLKIEIPEKWVIQESEVNKAIKQTGSEMVKGKTAQTEKALDAAFQRLTVLFTASKDILGMGNNAIMILSAEKAPATVPYRSGKDYLRLNLDSFKRVQLPPDFKYSETINSEKLGNETFYSLDIQRSGFKQRFYATARKGYALFFTLSYMTDEDLETIKGIIRNSDFAWKE
ncbi:MAG TPA: hypothetical protein VF721_01345 [Pyrinomonadaceae bacterium]